MTSQDLRVFLDDYETQHPDDVVRVETAVSADQDITAVVWELAARGEHPLLRFTHCRSFAARRNLPLASEASGDDHDIVTNMFASRARIERMLGAEPEQLHERYEELAADPRPLELVDSGRVLDHIDTGADIDLTKLPLITHFETDLGPYITSGIIVGEDPNTGCGNLSYHRAVVADRNTLATSLHSRGDLWRLLQDAEHGGRSLPVAMVIGAHPLFMLAASARVPLSVDEREVAGGLFGEPLEVVRTPMHGLRVPASAEYVLEGVIDPTVTIDEGPFGEFSGYSSDRSTHSRFDVQAILHRDAPLWLDIVGGNSDEHLNLARVPRESEMSAKIKARFPSVEAMHYPNSGTHFHCYVSVDQRRPGEARQIMLALLGWDPYLKTVIAVDSDIDLNDDSDVMWAMATHFQPARDLFVIDGLPGSPLDPSSSPDGSTSRLALDATRAPDFDGTRIVISERAKKTATDIVSSLRR